MSIPFNYSTDLRVKLGAWEGARGNFNASLAVSGVAALVVVVGLIANPVIFAGNLTFYCVGVSALGLAGAAFFYKDLKIKKLDLEEAEKKMQCTKIIKVFEEKLGDHIKLLSKKEMDRFQNRSALLAQMAPNCKELDEKEKLLEEHIDLIIETTDEVINALFQKWEPTDRDGAVKCLKSISEVAEGAKAALLEYCDKGWEPVDEIVGKIKSVQPTVVGVKTLANVKSIKTPFLKLATSLKTTSLAIITTYLSKQA